MDQFVEIYRDMKQFYLLCEGISARDRKMETDIKWTRPVKIKLGVASSDLYVDGDSS